MNIKQLMRQAQQMQEQLQKKMSETRVEGTAGGGMVKATLSGSKELLAIEIDREAVDPEDVGKVIGKRGRIIRALRTLAKAAQGEGGNIMVEVVD